MWKIIAWLIFAFLTIASCNCNSGDRRKNNWKSADTGPDDWSNSTVNLPSPTIDPHQPTDQTYMVTATSPYDQALSVAADMLTSHPKYGPHSGGTLVTINIQLTVLVDNAAVSQLSRESSESSESTDQEDTTADTSRIIYLETFNCNISVSCLSSISTVNCSAVTPTMSLSWQRNASGLFNRSPATIVFFMPPSSGFGLSDANRSLKCSVEVRFDVALHEESDQTSGDSSRHDPFWRKPFAFSSRTFTYHPNPQVFNREAQPTGTADQAAYCILSGGFNITFSGKNLNSSAFPMIVVSTTLTTVETASADGLGINVLAAQDCYPPENDSIIVCSLPCLYGPSCNDSRFSQASSHYTKNGFPISSIYASGLAPGLQANKQFRQQIAKCFNILFTNNNIPSNSSADCWQSFEDLYTINYPAVVYHDDTTSENNYYFALAPQKKNLAGYLEPYHIYTALFVLRMRRFRFWLLYAEGMASAQTTSAAIWPDLDDIQQDVTEGETATVTSTVNYYNDPIIKPLNSSQPILPDGNDSSPINETYISLMDKHSGELYISGEFFRAQGCLSPNDYNITVADNKCAIEDSSDDFTAINIRCLFSFGETNQLKARIVLGNNFVLNLGTVEVLVNATSSNYDIPIIASSASFAVLLAVVFVVVFVIHARWKKQQKIASKRQSSMLPPPIDPNYIEAFSDESALANFVATRLSPGNGNEELVGGLKRLFIPSSGLQLGEVIGRGNYGIVYKGKLTGTGETVAVKVLKSSRTSDIIRFLREGLVMQAFEHPNIVRLRGLSVVGPDPHIIVEYLPNGNLRDFIPNEQLCEETGVDVRILIDFCVQICAGMSYLAEMRCVHRDLACRNVMVKSIEADREVNSPPKIQLKIGDFGLARDLHDSDYYRPAEDISPSSDASQQTETTDTNSNFSYRTPLPIRWHPPESLITGRFVEKSDVFSFGVVCWEIFSGAAKPYRWLSNAQVVEYVCGGHRLPKPRICSIEMYDKVMLPSWAHDRDSRPTFAQLRPILDVIQSQEEFEAAYSAQFPAQSLITSTLSSGATHRPLQPVISSPL